MSEEPASEPKPPLADDWKPPIREVQAKLWHRHPQREMLDERYSERDEQGNPAWILCYEADEDDERFFVVWLRPTDPQDALRPADPRHERYSQSVRVGTVAREALTAPIERAQLIISEHFLDE